MTWEVTVWFYHSPALLASKEKPMQHPISSPSHLSHATETSAAPSLWQYYQHLSPVSWQAAMSPKHTTCQEGKAFGTARCSYKLDSWTPEWSSGTSNNLVGFWGGEIVEWRLRSASTALNYNASSTVKIGKNKPNPNLGSAPLNQPPENFKTAHGRAWGKGLYGVFLS